MPGYTNYLPLTNQRYIILYVRQQFLTSHGVILRTFCQESIDQNLPLVIINI